MPSPSFQNGAHVAGFEATEARGAAECGDHGFSRPDRHQVDDGGQFVLQPQRAGRGRRAQERLRGWTQAYKRQLGSRPRANATRGPPIGIGQVAEGHLAGTDRIMADHLGTAVADDHLLFVGHGTLRSCVMGADDRAPTKEELARMRALLAKSMDEGAIGLASGLIYPPSAFGTTDELAALCEVVRDKGGLYASHIRNESTKLLDAVEENLEIGRRAHVRVELSHHKASGQKNWGKVKESTALIERARRKGVDVTADQHPYTASSTGLAVTIPNWVHEGGTAKMCERLRDPAVRARIRSEEVETGRAFDRIVIARARLHPEWAGKSVQDLADAAGRDPLEWSCDALIEHDGAVDIVHHSMSEDDVRFVMAKEWICIGSDSRANAPYGPLSFGKPHPRSYGTFPRVLGRYARDEKVLGLEDAVRKMTSLTASRPRVHDRGVVREGAWADLVVFDPARVIDAATYDDPHRYPVGLDYVIVNGGVALEHGETTPVRRGRFLRQGRDLGGR